MRYLLLLLIPALLAAQGQRPRVAIAQLSHESNSFNPRMTEHADFPQRALSPVPAVLDDWARSKDTVSGFVIGGRRENFDLLPTFVAAAIPRGPVSAAAFERLTGELTASLKKAPKLDGLLLSLHGAMVAEKYPHGDLEVLKRVRAAVGPAVPIVVVHDFHANIAPEMIRHCNALLTFKENPHVDTQDRGIQAARIMAGIVSGRTMPVQAVAKPDMVYNILHQNTFAPPLKPIVDESKRLEENPKVLAVSVSGGYQYGDAEWMGPSVVVVTDNDQALAEREAQRLSRMLWETRDRLAVNLPEPDTAVRQASAAAKTPVVLVEMGDNIGGGSSGDATFILEELVRQKARGWVVMIAEPARSSPRRSAWVSAPRLTRWSAARWTNCTALPCASGDACAACTTASGTSPRPLTEAARSSTRA
ncbi:MAG: M81 family metallopeptidase [Bryobacterales bacterium]|nr:M81 family metallopeptidase [Bryobacterales bacterium]